MTVEVHVVTPDREVWSGTAESVVARGVDGEVGILAGHAPLLIQLAIGPLRILRDEGDLVAVVDGGFMHVSHGDEGTRVDVMADGAELSGDIDVAAARTRETELQDRLQSTDTGAGEAEVAGIEADLKKARARIALGD